MKFVADENVFKHTVSCLREDGHEILYVAEESRRLQDRTILRLALQEEAVVLTYDKDYKYLTVEEKLPSFGVVWVRRQSRKANVEAETERIVHVIREYGEDLRHYLTVIYPDRVERIILLHG